MDRREFLRASALMGLAGIAPKQITAAEIDYYPFLLRVVEEQGRMHDQEMSDQVRENLRYACLTVRPRSHDELAFVAAIGPRWMSYRDLADEYVRRRSGLPPSFYDHPLLELRGWGMPETYRILIYREQLLTLINELTGMSKRDSITLFYKYLQGRAGIPPLESMATESQRNALTSQDFRMFERMIREYGVRSMPYTWCSAMASRAEKLARG